MRRGEKLALAVALVVVMGAAVISHQWGEKSLSPIYLVLVLTILAVAFEGPRDWLGKATNIKLPGGFEFTRAVEDAVDAAETLPDIDEGDDDSPSDDGLKILEKEWWKDPPGAVLALRAELADRLRWLDRELFGLRGRPAPATIEQLRASGLIRPYEARLATAVYDASGTFVARELKRDGDRAARATGFIEKADKVIYQIRLIAFDARIRDELEARRLRIIDIHGQPSSRWADFYVFDPEHEAGPPKALRVSVRMARTSTSDLIDGVRKRYREDDPETPFDDDRVRRVIVFPQTSKTRPPDDSEIPAFKRDAFFTWVDAWAKRRKG